MPSSWTQIYILPLGVLLLCLTGNTASGSCGDYLHTRFGPPATQHHQSSTSNESDLKDDDNLSNHSAGSLNQAPSWTSQIFQSQSDPRPCSDPGCRSSQRRFPNPAAPVPVELTVPTKAVHSSDDWNRTAENQSGLPIAEPLHLAAGYANRVDRPPQPIG